MMHSIKETCAKMEFYIDVFISEWGQNKFTLQDIMSYISLVQENGTLPMFNNLSLQERYDSPVREVKRILETHKRVEIVDFITYRILPPKHLTSRAVAKRGVLNTLKRLHTEGHIFVTVETLRRTPELCSKYTTRDVSSILSKLKNDGHVASYEPWSTEYNGFFWRAYGPAKDRTAKAPVKGEQLPLFDEKAFEKALVVFRKGDLKITVKKDGNVVVEDGKGYHINVANDFWDEVKV